MNDLGYMAGYDETYFGPQDSITRAQLSKVGVLVTGVHTPEVERLSQPTFADVGPAYDLSGNPVPYPFDYVEEATGAGLIQGTELTGTRLFDPYRTLSRVQLAQILARMASVLKGYAIDPTALLDGVNPGLEDVPEYARADVRLVASLGLMQGYGDRFDPWATAQRGHVALVMTRFLDLPAYEPPPATSTDPPPEPAPPSSDQKPTPATPGSPSEPADEPAVEAPPPAQTHYSDGLPAVEEPASEPLASDLQASTPSVTPAVTAAQAPSLPSPSTSSPEG